MVARRALVKTGAQAITIIRSLLVTAPLELRERLEDLPAAQLITTVARLRPGSDAAKPVNAAKTALRSLAQLYQATSQQAQALTQQLQQLVKQVNPQLLELVGVGPVSAAQLLITAGANPDRVTSEAKFAHLCDVAPIPASSGKTNRYRLNRGGDRQANAALHTIVLVRMSHDPETKAYVARKREEGKTTKEIMRILKRYLARTVYKTLTKPQQQANVIDFRKAREAKGYTITEFAAALEVIPARISDIELNKRPHSPSEKPTPNG